MLRTRGVVFIAVVWGLLASGTTAHAQGKAIVEGVKILSRGGAPGGRAVVETVRTSKVLQVACNPVTGVCRLADLGVEIEKAAVAAQSSNVGEAIDAAARAAVAKSLPEGESAMSSFARELGLTETENSGFDPTFVDGWLSVRNTRGDLVFLEPEGRSLEELMSLAKSNAILPSNGKPKDGLLFYVNGIRTTPEDHSWSLLWLANATNTPVVGVYNATRGAFWDVGQTALDRLSNIGRGVTRRFGVEDWITFQLANNKAVNTVQELTMMSAREGQEINFVAHSQGGADTALGLQRARAQLELDKLKDPLSGVSVISMGSAARIWPYEIDSQHLIHVHDATPRFLGLGSTEAAWGGDNLLAGPERTNVIRFKGSAPTFVEAESRIASLPKVRFTKHHDVNRVYVKAYEQFLGQQNAVAARNVMLGPRGMSAPRKMDMVIDPKDVNDLQRTAWGGYRLWMADGTIIDAQNVVMAGTR